MRFQLRFTARTLTRSLAIAEGPY